jgi:hypothetical protein
MEVDISSCTWIFGRGASIANGLKWVVPGCWNSRLMNNLISRDDHIELIKEALRAEMANLPLYETTYMRLIEALHCRTVNGSYHQLITTNWDYLLSRDIDVWIRENNIKSVPRFLGAHSAVYHLNGTVEPGVSSQSTQFLLETDSSEVRKNKLASNTAINHIVWTKCLVVVGMSFECEIDRGLLAVLKSLENSMPIGDAYILIIEPNEKTLDSTKSKVHECLPFSRVVPIALGLREWINAGMPELVDFNILK